MAQKPLQPPNISTSTSHSTKSSSPYSTTPSRPTTRKQYLNLMEPTLRQSSSWAASGPCRTSPSMHTWMECLGKPRNTGACWLLFATVQLRSPTLDSSLGNPWCRASGWQRYAVRKNGSVGASGSTTLDMGTCRCWTTCLPSKITIYHILYIKINKFIIK